MIMGFCDQKTMLSIGLTSKTTILHYKFNLKALLIEKLERHLQERPVPKPYSMGYILSLHQFKIIMLFYGFAREWQFYSSSLSDFDSSLCWSYYQSLKNEKYEMMYVAVDGGGICIGRIQWNISSIMQHVFGCDCFPETRQIWGKKT